MADDPAYDGVAWANPHRVVVERHRDPASPTVAVAVVVDFAAAGHVLAQNFQTGGHRRAGTIQP